ncbi:MAG TPA: shikimate kinase [Candidatus Cybelea sp.]|nr:shikimate kinase [Candidatus Cybelea sp.]
MKRHLALIGFMAAGKSTIGRRLARELGWAFFDTDAFVVRAHGTVAAIFDREGEAAFRRYEHEAIAHVLAGPIGGVIALGGGALTLVENRAMLAAHAHRVFLKASPEQIFARVRRNRKRRPLLGERPTIERIRELYEARLADYSAVDHIVEARKMSDREVLDDILQWLRKNEIALQC